MKSEEPTESYKQLLEEISNHGCIPGDVLNESIAVQPCSAGADATFFVM